MHSNADGLPRMTYEPMEVPTLAVTDALMDDNFINAVDLGMRESDFDSCLIQLANEDKANYQFGGELLHYTAAIDVNDGSPLMGRDPLNFEETPLHTGGTAINCNASAQLIGYEEKLNIADFPGQLSAGCLVLTGCPVSGTGSHESEAVLSVTSVAAKSI